MNSDKAFVSGSENGVGPAYASLHGLVDEPGSGKSAHTNSSSGCIYDYGNNGTPQTCMMEIKVPIWISANTIAMRLERFPPHTIL